LLRLPLADEVQCLLERIDKMENMYDTSYTPIRNPIPTNFVYKFLNLLFEEYGHNHANAK
jgi:hypothetical protein